MNIVGVYNKRVVVEAPVEPNPPMIRYGEVMEKFVVDESGLNGEMKKCLL